MSNITDVQIIILTTRRRNGFAYLAQCLPRYAGLEYQCSIFCDGGYPDFDTSPFLVTPYRKVGGWRLYYHAVRMLHEIANDWVMICEDDVLFGDGLAQSLGHVDELGLPPITSLCHIGSGPRPLMPAIEMKFPPLPGAQALLYHISALDAFMNSASYEHWHLDKGPDLALSEHLQQNNLLYGAAFPAWGQHIGEVSSYPEHGNLDGRQASSVMSPGQWARLRLETL